MKKLRILLILCVLACSLFTLAACQNNALPRPTGLKIDASGDNLIWDSMSSQVVARYEVSIDGDIHIVRENEYDISRLEPGNHKLRVKAISKGGAYSNSPWSETLAYTKDVESGLRYTLINNQKEYELTGIGSWNFASDDPNDPDKNKTVIIDSVFRGKKVTSIGASAFSNCRDMIGVVIPDTITNMGERAFINCRSLKEVTLPEGLTSLGASAFQNCEAIEKITIPSSLSSLPAYVFAYCKSLNSISFSEGLTSIGNYAFLRCDTLKSVTLPDSVTSIGVSSFSECQNLSDIKMPNVETLGSNSFRLCDNLTTIEIPNLKEIGSGSFYGCVKLNNISGPSVTRISSEAFYNCTALNNCTFGDNVEYMGENAFMLSGFWNNALNGDGAVYVNKWLVNFIDYTATNIDLRPDTVGIGVRAFTSVKVEDPETHDVKPEKLNLSYITLPDSIQNINEYAFYACSSLSNISFGTGLKRIGLSAFAACSALSNLTFSEGLEEIGGYAFYSCKKLMSVNLPKSLKEIGTYAFHNTGIWENAANGQSVYVGTGNVWFIGIKKASDEEIEVPGANIKEGTVGISDYAFYQLASLTTVSIPESLQYIGYGAFYECESLASINLKRVVEIDDYAFYGCIALSEVTLGTRLEKIGFAAFNNCALIGDVTLPTTIKVIDEYAFNKCKLLNVTNFDKNLVNLETIGGRAFYQCSLRSVEIPEKITEIRPYVFYGCETLTKLTLNDNITKIGARAFYDTGITDLVLPDALTELGEHAFRGCAALTSVAFNDKLQTIGNYAFFGCEQLTGVTLPQSVTSIGAQAFRNCNALTSIVLGENIQSVGVHAFFGCYNLTVYAEAEALPEGWNTNWNTSRRPVIWNCSLSSDRAFVQSIVYNKDNVQNVYTGKDKDEDNGDTQTNKVTVISAPYRDGYVCVGWSYSDGGNAEVPTGDIINVPEGTVLYAVWNIAE